MDVKMELSCTLAVVNRQGGVIEDFSKGSITARNMGMKPTPPEEEPFIIVRTASKNIETKYNLIGNIDNLFTRFLDEGRATVCLKEPSNNIIITKADPDELTTFIVYLKKFLPKDSPVHVSMAASEPPARQLYLYGQEEYKLRMENIIELNSNLDNFINLEIRNCTLELAGYQVPIAGAIREMKNLTTLRLNNSELHSSTFLEIESKELKQLHLCHSKIQLPIASLFKNDLCYKDSLVELNLEGNRWSEIPNGIFEFRNLLKLSLNNNCITHLPDKFTNLPKLEDLSLSHNRLTHVPPSIFQIENLLKLSLDNNIITELPNISTNSPKLQVLSLSRNQITHLPPSIFELQNLFKLDLDNNRITELPDMFSNLSKLLALNLSNNELRSVPPSIFQLQTLSWVYLNNNFITELPDKFHNLPNLKCLLLSHNQLQYLPLSIFALQVDTFDVASNPFNFEIPPSIGSELIAHSLKELSYRTILNHKLKVEEGMLPKKFLNDLANYRQCICGRKYVDEGQDLSFFYDLNDLLSHLSYYTMGVSHNQSIAISGNICNDVKLCFPHKLLFELD